MLSDVASTKLQPVKNWHDFVAETFLPLEVKPRGSGPFIYSAFTEQIGDLTISELRTSSCTVTRTAALVSQSNKAIYKASFQLSGRSEIIQNNKHVIINPRQWAIYDTMQPYSVSVSEGSHFIVLQINQHLLSMRDPYLQAAFGHCFEGSHGCGYLIFQMLASALLQSDRLSEQAEQGISNSILQLISAQISETLAPSPKLEAVCVHQAQLLKIKHHITQQLHNPDLSVDYLCEVFKCSRRYLYNLFSMQGLTPAEHIQCQRFEGINRHLADPNYQRPISELAYQYGFKDAAAFSHAFRRRYGVSPTAWRQKQLHLGVVPS